MELIGPDIALGLKGERIKEDSGFLRSIYQGREPQRGNRCGRRDESFQVESSVHYEIRSRIGGWPGRPGQTRQPTAEGAMPCSELVE